MAETITSRKLHPVNGLTSKETALFFEILIKANKQQIEAMLLEIENEIRERINAKNWG